MQKEYIDVVVEGQKIRIEKGTVLETISKNVMHEKTSLIVAGIVNNEIKELTYPITAECDISFVDMTTDDGIRIYQRSLIFLLVKAFTDIYPDKEIEIRHSVSRGIFFEPVDLELDKEDVEKIEKRMKSLVEKDIPFRKEVLPTEKAKERFLRDNRIDRYGAIKYREKPHVSYYVLDGTEDYFYGYMVPSTGYLKLFRLEYYNCGIVLISPRTTSPNILETREIPEKLFQIFTEYRKWVSILGVDNVGKLNDIVEAGKINEFIRISEALHEKKIAQIADMIYDERERIKVILIAGPSSSGKTTFAQRLSIQLRVNGLIPINISIDDYFVEKKDTPLDENGKPDYESVEAIDLKLFNEQLNNLVQGKEVHVPFYNFITGKREYRNNKLNLNGGKILIIEGIHGLNPRLTSEVDENKKFKIYISAITSMRIDRHNRIPTTDLRFIRRMVRDHQFRGCPPERTIELWPSVRNGEEKNIFPFQEEADIMFNSSLIYELGVLKSYALPLLRGIGPELPQYSESRRLIEFLSYFLAIGCDEIPPNSILREFIGGSCFR